MTGRVESITIYPVKSCRGVSLDSAEIVTRGLMDDRRFMLVDESGRFITQREEHSLTRIDVSLSQRGFRLQAPGQVELEIPKSLQRGDSIEVEVWRSRVNALVEPEGSRWFGSYLGRDVRLVHFPDRTQRIVEDEDDSFVAFQDAYPFLVISRSSLEDLNRRLPRALEMERFRPNLVLTGVPPYAEDSLQRFQIGSVRFRMTRPCVRCVVTTLDPRTGEAGKEPLATLAGYHTFDDKVSFGVNAVHETLGILGVGDPLTLE